MTKVFYIMSNYDEVLDIQVGENNRQIAENTMDFIVKNDMDDNKNYRIEELECNGVFNEDRMNVVMTVYMNGKPHEVFVNQYDEMVNVEENYILKRNDEYRKYAVKTEFIAGDKYEC